MKNLYKLLTVSAIVLCCGCSASGKLTNKIPLPSESQSSANAYEESVASADKRAEDIADIIKEMPEIEHCSVVITGSTAIIGIVVYDDPTDKELIDLRKSIEKKVLAFDREINHVAVSAAPELYEKITNIKNDKKPAEERELHKNEGNKLFFRMLPTF